MADAQHTPGSHYDAMPLELLQEQLQWSERHAADMTIHEHNRKWFAAEAIKLRAAITKTIGEQP